MYILSRQLNGRRPSCRWTGHWTHLYQLRWVTLSARSVGEYYFRIKYWSQTIIKVLIRNRIRVRSARMSITWTKKCFPSGLSTNWTPMSGPKARSTVLTLSVTQESVLSISSVAANVTAIRMSCLPFTWLSQKWTNHWVLCRRPNLCCSAVALYLIPPKFNRLFNLLLSHFITNWLPFENQFYFTICTFKWISIL